MSTKNDGLERVKYNVVFAIDYTVEATDGDEAIEIAQELFNKDLDEHNAGGDLFGVNADRVD